MIGISPIYVNKSTVKSGINFVKTLFVNADIMAEMFVAILPLCVVKTPAPTVRTISVRVLNVVLFASGISKVMSEMRLVPCGYIVTMSVETLERANSVSLYLIMTLGFWNDIDVFVGLMNSTSSFMIS